MGNAFKKSINFFLLIILVFGLSLISPKMVLACCGQSCGFGYECVNIPSTCPDPISREEGSCVQSQAQCTDGTGCASGEACVDYICVSTGSGGSGGGGGGGECWSGSTNCPSGSKIALNNPVNIFCSVNDAGQQMCSYKQGTGLGSAQRETGCCNWKLDANDNQYCPINHEITTYNCCKTYETSVCSWSTTSGSVSASRCDASSAENPSNYRSKPPQGDTYNKYT